MPTQRCPGLCFPWPLNRSFVYILCKGFAHRTLVLWPLRISIGPATPATKTCIGLPAAAIKELAVGFRLMQRCWSSYVLLSYPALMLVLTSCPVPVLSLKVMAGSWLWHAAKPSKNLCTNWSIPALKMLRMLVPGFLYVPV